LAAVLAVLVSACAGTADRPALPPPALTEEDLAVLTAALPAEPVVIADRTLRACDVHDYSPHTHECIAYADLLRIESVVRGQFGERAVETFRTHNRVSLPIPTRDAPWRTVSADELLTLLDAPEWPLRLPRIYPGATHIVLLTAPIYPAAGEAVVFLLEPLRRASIVHAVRKDTWLPRSLSWPPEVSNSAKPKARASRQPRR
jgi:hypothetical protein